MLTLNKEIFKHSQQLLGILVSNKLISTFSNQFKGCLFIREKFKAIQLYDSDTSKKLILLNDKFKNEQEIPDNLKEFIKNNKIEIIEKQVELNYDNYSYEQVLKKVLPENMTIPFSYEKIGHIAHLNLRDEQLPYKFIIGQVILDKNFQIRTVINKVGKIDTVFRTFKNELLAGENNLLTEIKENECIFKFNFEEVYWNSRLQIEHWNLIDSFTKDDIVCDMFAGVGPFALPAVKLKKCKVYANDLNPNSIKYMRENAKLNKISSDKLIISNLDAREFVRSLLLVSDKDSQPVPITQVIMNLPSTSIEFLDVFREIFLNADRAPPISKPPTIHCYTFTKGRENSDLVSDTRKNVEDIIGCRIPDDFKCTEVRDVSAHKIMMRISFVMPTNIKSSDNPLKRTVDQVSESEVSTDESKRLKLDNNNNNDSK
ncbi:tRNA (guanine-N1-)-methyltransferase [Tieghemostelium lacteum]|uniref:tRNA (guanine(37)-N1)-methyltransferase n=1 Tax=Tieghemostelium lacteum TaxID=361077 RepID=A0A152A909_TIELA|nr:tRNA (guanine-N1-)-methyltransferase [Tieghemostelium lacteum]|eukprot:KYR02708.1 tRNA (guanine-N1-)-methyltransferase [Tieghemostelium lacteum]